ncbi:MAG: MFS transporter [Firmicutes bacterium]|nr:MFS transporter [Bacillota bacterium]
MTGEQEFDQGRLGAFHYRLLTVAGLGTLFDSVDVGIVSFVMAALISAWRLDPFWIGVVGSINLVGMAIGAALAGSIADRVGRRQIFMLTLLIYSVATGLSGLSIALWMLLLCRFVVGLGLGGELPVTTTMVTEFLPAHDRGRGIVLLESFWAVGWLVASVVAFVVIPLWGWRVAFLLGTLPALYVLYLRRGIPESPRFLLRTGRSAEARRVMSLVQGREIAAADLLGPSAVTRPRLSVLFQPVFRRRTAMLWILWVGMNFAYYGMFLWLPSVLVDRGFSLVNSFGYTLIVTAAEIPGYLSAAWLIDRFGRKPVLVSYIFLTAVFAALFGHAAGVAGVLWFGCLLGFFNLGAWGTTYAYTTEQYPTLVRGTGAGWAMGVGRIGGIVGPTIVGALLASRVPVGTVFGIFTLVLIVVAGMVLILGRETRHHTMADIEVGQ